MTAIHANKVKDVLNELKAVIDARATADSITIGEVKVGMRARGDSLLREGAYILAPDNPPPDYPANKQRKILLQIPVWIITRDLRDKEGTERLIELVGLVLDAVGEKQTLNGKCILATTQEGEVQEDADDDGILYSQLVTVNALIQYAMS